MSASVEQRVVQMEFQNGQFEQAAKESLNTIDKLKKSLNFEGAANGLKNIQDSVTHFNVGTMAGAVQTVIDKFSALDVIGLTALSNIANKALHTGQQIVSAFTIDPVKTGFSEYETQINATQTILANTQKEGATLDDVNAALDELNAYADKTIYNFTEMTRNIGTFTAAGVDLKTSVSAIKGIANLAAISGSTSQQASTAMYQLSQALASGTVKLMDWNSVVNAGMGGQVFQDSLMETARLHGVAIDEMIKNEGSFRDTLSQGWLTAEILTDTLEKFTGDLSKADLIAKGYSIDQAEAIYNMSQTATDAATKVKTFTQLVDTLKEAAQSGWSASWRIIVGDFEEAKALYTEISDTLGAVIEAGNESRINLLIGWKKLGGRDSLIQSIKNLLTGLLSVINPIREAFGRVFEKIDSQGLFNLTKGFENFTAGLRLTETGQKNLSIAFEAFFRIIKVLRDAVFGVVGVFAKLLVVVNPVVTAVLYLAGAIGVVVNSLFSIFSSFENFESALDSVYSFFNDVVNIFNTFGGGIDGTVQAIFYVIQSAFFKGIDLIEQSTGKKFLELRGLFLLNFMKVRKSVEKSIKAIQKGFQTGDWSEALEPLYTMNSNVQAWFDNIYTSYVKGGRGITGVIEVIFTQISLAVRGAMDYIQKVTGYTMEEYKKQWISSIRKIQEGVIWAVGNFKSILEKYDWSALGLQPVLDFLAGVIEKIKELGGALSTVISDFLSKLNPFGKINEYVKKEGDRISGGFSTVSTAVSGALKDFGFDDFVKLMDTGVFGLLSFGLFKIASAFSKLMKGIDTDFIEKIGKLIDNVGKSITGVLNELTNSLKTLQAQVKAKIIKQIAIAVGILAAALLVLSRLDADQLKTGLAGLGGTLIELGGLLVVVKKTLSTMDAEQIGKAGTALLEFGAAVWLIAKAAEALGNMNFWAMVQGFGAITAFIIELGAVAWVFSKFKMDLAKGAESLVLLAIAVNALTKPVKALAEIAMIDSDALWQGVKAVSALIGVLTIAASIFSLFDKNIKIAGLISFSGAILILTGAVKLLGMMKYEEVNQGLHAIEALFWMVDCFLALTSISVAVDKAGKGILLLSAGMLVLTFAVKMLAGIEEGPLVTAVEAVAALMFIIALAINDIPQDSAKRAAGLLIVAAALNILAVAVAAFTLIAMADSVWAGLGVLALLLTEVVIALNLLEGTQSGAVAILIFSAALVVLTTSLVAFSLIPFPLIIIGLIELAAALGIVIAAGYLANGAAIGLAALGAAMLQIGVGMLAFGASILLISTALTLLGTLGIAAGAAIITLGKAVAHVAKAFVEGLAQGITGALSYLALAAPLIGESIKMIVTVILTKLGELWEQFKVFLQTLLDGILDFIVENGPKLISAGINFLMFLLTGIRTNIGDMVVVVGDIIAEFIRGLSEKIGEIIDAGIEFIVEFINGIADGIETHQQEIIDSITHLGEALIDGLIAGLGAGITLVTDKVREIGGKILDAIKDFFGIASPSKEFEDIGTFLIDGLIKGISGMVDSAVEAVRGLADRILGIFKKDDEHEDTGEDNINHMITGYKDHTNDATKTAENIVQKVISTIQSYNPKFLNAGKNSMANMIEGYKSKSWEANSAAGELASDAAEEIEDQQDDWYDAGVYLIRGFIEAIEDNTWMAERAARIMAERALEEAEEEFDIASPSKAFYQIGEYVVQGFAMGVTDETPYASKSVSSMAEDSLAVMKKSVQTLSDLIHAEFDEAPTVRPVLDLEEIQNGSKKISQMLNNSTIDVSGITANAKNVAATFAKAKTPESTTPTSSETTYNFNQYNQSPKSLSRLEIYRQTRNQFNAFREEMGKE